jgi:ABC-2 type transport system ATP-binding protein
LIIAVKDLHKRFGDTVALSGVTTEIEAGATGLLGPNGAGKTTLLRILLGLLPADGSATVMGIDPMRRPRQVRARLGYMPESECLIPGLLGIKAVAFLGRLAGMARRAALQRAHEVLYYVGLGEARYREVGEFSFGMQQRLKLAQALVHDPDLLFLDEPTNGLDPKGRHEMLTVIRGKVVRQGTIAELTKKTEDVFDVTWRGDEKRFGEELRRVGAEPLQNERYLVKVPSAQGTVPIFKAATAAGVQIRGLKPLRRSLEDVFMEAMRED